MIQFPVQIPEVSLPCGCVDSGKRLHSVNRVESSPKQMVLAANSWATHYRDRKMEGVMMKTSKRGPVHISLRVSNW